MCIGSPAKGDQPMEMFLMVVCMSLLGLGVTALAFGAATKPVEEETKPLPEQVREPIEVVVPTRFFADTPAPPLSRPRVPIEALLLQIDNHVRLEQAAAESFLESPSVALLHSRTISPLVH